MNMQLNNHWRLEGKHALFGASTYHWLNYSDEKVIERLATSQDAARGTRLHDLAKELILLGQKLGDTGQTLNSYVNDCIGYRMTPEVILYFSDDFFGTADALSFRINPQTKKMRLRVFDLKTGKTKASEKQLWIYIALFCLEYEVDVFDIEIDGRIYQHDMIYRFDIEPETIFEVMQKIKHNDKLINDSRLEGQL